MRTVRGLPDYTAPLIVNVALTGMVPRRREHPAVPEQPGQIAADAVACIEAGASSLHLHARDGDGEPTCRRETYGEIIRLVRALAGNVVVCVSTSGRVHRLFEERADVLDLEGDLKPDLASLTLGSMNFPAQVSVNEPAIIRRLADAMRERRIVPELEVFDFGMLDYAHYLIDRGVLREPFVFNLLLGSLGTLSATPEHLALLVARLPAGATWHAAGIGRAQWPVNAMGVTMGGHVRTGLEDSLYMDAAKQQPATNAQLVGRVAALAAALGRPLATVAGARRLLGLPAREPVELA
jgi:3-keto-5-aminohexanoate cleavage enzyme